MVLALSMLAGLQSQSATHPKFEILTSRRKSAGLHCAPSLWKGGASGSVETNFLRDSSNLSISDAGDGEECHDEYCEGDHGTLVSAQDQSLVDGGESGDKGDSGDGGGGAVRKTPGGPKYVV